MVGRRKQVEINRIIVGWVCEGRVARADSYGIKASPATRWNANAGGVRFRVRGCERTFHSPPCSLFARVFIDFRGNRRCLPIFPNLDGKIIIGRVKFDYFFFFLESFKNKKGEGLNEYISDFSFWFSREIEFSLLRRKFWIKVNQSYFDSYYFLIFFESMCAKYMVNELSEIYFGMNVRLVNFESKILTN